jgi:hypothetical protein
MRQGPDGPPPPAEDAARPGLGWFLLGGLVTFVARAAWALYRGAPFGDTLTSALYATAGAGLIILLVGVIARVVTAHGSGRSGAA